MAILGCPKKIVSEDMPVTSIAAYRWPEFQAFLTRLGVDPSTPVTKITLEMDMKGCVKLVQEQVGRFAPNEGG
jgi:hypothetical protein